MFTIKCGKCGAEGELKIIGKSFEREPITIFTAGYEGQIGIACNKCDNEIEEDF